MKLTLDYLNQVRSSPTAEFFTGETFDQLSAQIPAAYHQEHTVDDKHSTIHASGPVYERGRTTAMGVWLSALFSSSYFSAITGSTWTVTNDQVVAWEYTLIGSTMIVGFYIESSTIGTAAASTLYITIPANYVATRRMFSTFAYDDNGTRGTGVVQVRPQSAAPNAGTTLQLTKDPRAVGTFSTSSAFSVFGQIAFEILQTDAQAIVGESFSASGGTITVVGNKTIHTFTASGSFVVVAGSTLISYLIVGGGGGGGKGFDTSGATGSSGGGGAGAMLTGSDLIAGGTFPVVVGAGGASITNGSDSTFNSHTATGGGKGGNGFNVATVGSNGGSGGGGGGDTVAGKAGGSGGTGGNNGGLGNTDGAHPAGAGGGGAGAVGQAAGANAGGNGGNGSASSISGSSVTYAGGGGGAGWRVADGSTDGTGGTGGGGGGSHTGAGTAGTANTGGGGGGGAAAGGGAGGSGIVIISYTTP